MSNSMKTIVVTGGAGYIGSHAVFLLAQQGYHVVIVDNLSRGYMQCVEFLQSRFSGQIEFRKADLLDLPSIQAVFREFHVDAIMHFAAFCVINEASEHPERYYINNSMGSVNLISAMTEYGVKDIIFSSTCAVYGDNQYLPLDELHPVKPLNAYGNSKLLVELVLKDYHLNQGLNFVILRYFNVCGAQEEGLLGDSKKPSMSMMQNAVRGALGIEPFKFTCPVVDTPDGSPIRDYINVVDLGNAHIAALEYLAKGKPSDIFNVGTGTGSSVKEIVDRVEEIVGGKIESVMGEISKANAAKVYASIDKAQSILGWKPTHTVDESIQSLALWYRAHPHGWDY